LKTRTLSRQPTPRSPPPPPTLTSTSPPPHLPQTAPSPYLLPLRVLRFHHHHCEVAFLPKALGIAPALRHPRVTFAVSETSGYTREKMLRFWWVLLAPRSTFLQWLMSGRRYRGHARVDHRCAEDKREFSFAVHHLCDPFGREYMVENSEQILTFSPTDCGSPPSLLRVRISTLKLDKALPDLDHSAYPIKADDWRLCYQAGQSS